MPDFPIALPLVAGLIALSGLTGAIYGFAGFGAALLFMPVATRIVPPEVAVPVFALSAIGSFVSVFPWAVREADRRAFLGLGASVAALPAGLWVLHRGDPLVLRWAISLLVLATLAALIAGLRYKVPPGRMTWSAVGAAVGFSGGATGLNGPPMILFQLAGPEGVAKARANSIVVLTGSSFFIPVVLVLQGALDAGTALLGLALIPTYAAGGWVGRRLFDPSRGTLYRRIAYLIIGAAGISGLPVWD